MSERDNSQRLAVGAGAPADPDHLAPKPTLAGDGGTVAAASGTPPVDGTPPRPEGNHPLADDAVEAVVAFVDDLVVETGSRAAASDDVAGDDATSDDATSEESGTGESGKESGPGKPAG